jgi:esterase/lipase superfamily enzyme
MQKNKKWAALFVAFLLFQNTIMAKPKSYFLQIDPSRSNRDVVSPSLKTIKTGHFDFKTKQKVVVDSLIQAQNIEKGSAIFLQKCLLETTKTTPSVLIYIHGMWGNKPYYLNDNAQDFEANYANEGQNDIIIYLIWQGDALIYGRNYREATASVEQVTAILNGFLTVKNVELKVMCHSMGNYLFTKTIEKLNANEQIFQKILLLAPDVDAAYFASQLPKLKTLTKELDIFYHRKDLFLWYSGIRNGGTRLGRFVANQGETAIKTFDCTRFKNTSIAGKFSRHLYFRTSVDTRKIIKSLL